MATKNALVVASTVDSLIGQFRAHVLGRHLPAPAYVKLDVTGYQVSVHPHTPWRDGLAGRLGNLLVWAHTLEQVRAEWWRMDTGWVQITVHGSTSGGLRMTIHTGTLFSQTAGLVPLEVNQRDSVSLDELYTLAELLRQTQPDTGAA